MNTRYKMFRQFAKRFFTTKASLILTLLMTAGVGGVKAQQYVFLYKNGNTVFFLRNNSGSIQAQSDFDSYSSTCIWTGNSSDISSVTEFTNGGYNLCYANNNNNWALYLRTDGNFTTWRNRDYNRISAYYNNNNTTRYIYNNGSTWSLNNTNNPGTGVGYTVLFTYSNHDATLSTPSITGDELLTTTGDHAYSVAAKAKVQYHQFDGYSGTTATTYYWYNSALQTSAPTETDVTTGTWSLTGNTIGATTYASVNTSSGMINVSSIPPTDLIMTLSCTFTANGVNKTASKTIILQGTTVAEPTITNSGNNISMATTSHNATIYYTTDGSNPSASNGTAYSGPFSIENLTFPVTVKAIAIRNGTSSTISSETYNNPVCATPEISISSAGAVTITCSTAGTSIRYTTDGSTPTSTSGTVYSGSFNVSNLATVKAIAYKDGYSDSEVAEDQYVTSGTTAGGQVVLDDREIHSWSYYSDATCPIRSLNPADVKITYYGDGIVMTGNNDYTASSSDFVRTGNSNYVGGAKVNVGGENENTFVYYKTLERGDATQTAWTYSSGNQSSAASRCPYTPIPNPFQVRPTYGSRNVDANDFTGWRGFQCWRLKSVTKGAVYSAASGGTALSVGAIINAETEVYFAPNGEYGMEVELEAVWARAYLIKGNQGYANTILSQNVGVERNFMTLTANENYRFNGTTGRRITNVGYPVTISCYYPSGEAPDNTGGVVTGNNNNITLGANTKFENVTLNVGGNYISANGYNLTIGRGCSVTANTIQGLSSNSPTSFRMRIESASCNNLYFMGSSSLTSGVLTSVLGSDYDRAKKDNSKLRVTNDILVSNQGYIGSDTNVGADAFYCTAKSGDFYLTSDNPGGGYQFYLSSPQANRTYGKRTLIIEGGRFSDIAGGLDMAASTTMAAVNRLMVDIRIKGGQMDGAVYGAAQYSNAAGNRRMVITGGNFTGWIAGGANGTQDTGGRMAGASYIYVGGKANVNSNGSTTLMNRAVGGNVFGAGCGYSGTSTSGQVTEGSTVVVADEAYIERGVYGGGSYGYTTSTANVYILGGTIDGKAGGVNGTNYLATIDGGVYGGACQNQGGTVNLTMKGGTVNGSVYGGSNYTGTLSGTSTVIMTGGKIAGSLYGGGNGKGGATNVSGAVAVKVYGGTVTDAVYGCNNVNGSPLSTVTVDIYGTDPAPSADAYALGAVFGGGNQANYNGTPVVTVHNCDNSIEYVYGGGNAAAVAATDVTIWGGNKIGNVFGGGNGTVTAANVNGNAVTKIYGGTIGKVFGGSNSQGTISGSISVTVQKLAGDADPDGSATACDMHIDEVYGGGNMAASQAGSITIGCTGGEGEGIGDLYGGANQANIGTAQNPSNIALNITGGSIQRVFGGNNVSGTINGTITVNVNWATTNPCGYNYLGSVFGAGNLATYTGSLTVNILNGTVSGNVYGGGKGDPSDHTKGQVTGNPVVTIGDATKLNDNTVAAVVSGDVYGGGDAGNVVGTPQVNVINKCNTSIANVYGGGNAADVNGTDVNIDGGNITGMVFGGGHGDKNSTPQKEADVNGNVAVDVTGGTINKVFGGSNSKGTISGTVAVNIAKGANSCDMHITEVYGGGNEAAGNAGTLTIGCTGDYTNNGEGIGDVYGGANAADINNNISLSIRGGHINNVYGGNNTSGDINGTITVEVNWDNTLTCDKYLGNVFGGGNQAVYTAPTGSTNYPVVNILNGTVSGDVFGGGYGNASDPTKGVVNGNPQVTINGASASVVGGVYGGGSLAPTVGNPVVTLTNGSTVKVFGGGKAAGITGAPTVNINGGSVTTGVYGGCDSSGNVSGDIIVNINGGTLGVSGTPLTSGIFGGGYGSSTTTGGNVTVNVGDENAASAAATSTIYGDIYGGSALGTVNDAVADVTTVNINNGTIHGNIYGGGLGAATLNSNGYIDTTQVKTEAIVNGTVHVNIGTSTQASNFVTIDGQVFGCNNLAGTPKGPVYVDVYHTAHTTANTAPTPPAKAADVTSLAPTAFAIAAVYGGGNLAHYTTNLAGASTHVHIHNCDNTIEYVYGGGNAASSPATDVVIDGGRFNYIFGGGNGAGTGNPGADIEGNATATINGGVIYRAFGGSNTKGNIGGTSQVVLPDATTCDPRLVHEIFGGGNEAPGGNVDMVIPCGTTGTGIVYAGANKADMGTEADFNNGNPVLIKLTIEGGDFTQVFGGNNESGTIWGNVELYLKGGTIANAFGGNNLGGNIKGYIKVFVVDDESSCPLVLTNVYGGGYNAAYTPADPTIESPQVFINHIKSGNQILGNVFGGGYGTPATVTANPVVTIGDMETGHESNIATIAGNVYGGGEQASVTGSTKVIMQKANSVVKGTIYGAGKGVEDNPAAALVTENTLVQMTSGQVQRSIYGGGELSSVGTFTETYAATSGNDTDANYHVKGEPKTCAPSTGLTKVLISGGRVGLVNQLMPDPSRPTSDDDYGYVFCAGKGMADPTEKNIDGVPYANLLAVSDSSYLEISGTALIAASAYGGSENGQVLRGTHVKIVGGQIGSGHYRDNSGHHWDDPYTETQWTTAINKIKAGTFADADAAGFHQCDAWPFGEDGKRHVYDHFAEYLYNGEYYYDAAHTLSAQGGSKSGSDGHSYYGHVFGGGSGYYPWSAGKWRRTAGRVNGNTLVEITGGHILTNVYGGNEITDVLGKSKVVMKAGTVGVPRSIDSIQARPVNSYIFGAGMGDPRTLFNGWSNVGSSEVIVDSVAVVFGSIFGGGEDGHVLGNSSTTIKGNALIGTFGTSGVDGNIFGSGRGFSALALTAGVICGDITVNISENAKILGSVFGGGRLAAVGTYLSGEETTNYGTLIPEGQDPYGTGSTTHGNVTINITGGTIGTAAAINSTHDFSVGDVFGGSKGTLMNDWAKSQKLGLVKNTTVNISQATGYTTTIYGNVYGGGELASVGSYSYATQAQANTFNTTHSTEPMVEGDVNGLLEDGTGLATILITGGTIGQATPSDSKGHVFGGCLGRAGKGYSGYSFVNNSDVTLNGAAAKVYGSIFGGGENGHVMHNTDVKIKSGTVGIALDKASLPDANLNNDVVYKGNVYGGGRGIDTYNNNGTDTYSITAGKVGGNTNVTVEGGTVYRSVYGGGSLASVGIRDEATTTDGLATVTIKGGIIGSDGGASANNYNTLIPDRENRRENGFVFGSGRGMSAGANSTSNLVDLAYTKNTEVYIQGSANVTGSVFGGGENGHVKMNTKVYVKGGSVGTELTAAPASATPEQAKQYEHTIDDDGRGRLIYRGNVYGGGRGIDEGGDNKLSLTAGRVYGNTFVEVTGGHIYHDVFGGGSLASVGNETVNTTTGEVTYGDDSGLAEVHIKGGIIGYSEDHPELQGFNCGFVYGGCRGLSADPSSEIIKMAYVHETKVYIDSVADIKGSVFGGGANGHVKNDTYVSISGGSVGTALTAAEAVLDDHGVAPVSIFHGNVYAGGRGVDMFQVQQQGTTAEKYSLSAGAVYGNATLEMTGGHVWHNIYGSGAMASVGTVEAKTAGTHVHDEIVDGNGDLVDNTQYNPDESEINYLTGVFKTGTGKVTLTITGGTVGDTTPGHEGINNGNVFGAGRGVSASRSDYVASMEFVNDTEVTIGTSGQTSYTGSTPGELNYPYIYGNVYGGGENGHVKTDTDVKIHSGIIGFPLVEGTNGMYKTEADGSSKNPYQGNVFGGGCGVDPLYHGSTETRSSTAGRVYGHTNVTMTGGVVRRAIYGGGLLASVGVYRLLVDDMHITDMIEDEVDAGDATVTISGGYIGNVNPDGTALSGTGYLVPGDNNGHVFGSSCGMVADDYTVGGQQVDVQYRQMGYTHSTHVSISGGHLFGSVFGSGENGHVWEDATVNISGGEIGSESNSSTFIYAGNVYGSGRGVDHPRAHISETAGKVRGNTTVNVTGGTVWRDVYGGGSLASVGEADETASDSKKNVTTDPTTNNPFPYSTGLTRVVIDSVSVVRGSVYGSGRGVASTNTEYKQAAYVKNTLVTVRGNARVYQNVFGGGNAGHVRKNTDVTIDSLAKVDGNVYGGGAGDIASPTAGLVNHDVKVSIKGGVIGGDVYGGGAIANTNVHDVRNTDADDDCAEGTGRGNAKTIVDLLGGIILGNAYGGGQGVIIDEENSAFTSLTSAEQAARKANAGAMVQGDVTVTLNGTAFRLSNTQDDKGNTIPATGRVFGCNNLNGSPQGTVLVHVLQTKGLTESGGTYTVNDTHTKSVYDASGVLTTNNYDLEAVYGGGNLAAYEPWNANATGQYSTGVPATDKPLQVLIDGCDDVSIQYVYGGGNAASVPATQAIVKGAFELGYVFGGGNGKDRISYDGSNYVANPGAHVGLLADGTTSYGAGTADIYLFGGTIHNIFGGSNTEGIVRVKGELHINEAKDGTGNAVCPLILDEVYGGGNEAYMAGGTEIDLGCITYLKAIYGGARNADVGGDIVLTITSGHFDRVFGGNNVGGKISGAITVNIEETGCNPITIGELYGCGNQAAYSIYGYKNTGTAAAPVWVPRTSLTDGSGPSTAQANPTVNVKSFTSIGRIFGGGLGASAIVVGAPTVNINEVVGENANNTTWDYHQQVVNGETVGRTITYSDLGYSVTMPTHEAGKIGAIGTVFGGGNAAQVKGSTAVNVGTETSIKYTSDAATDPARTVVGVDIRGNVFGGGNQADVTGNTNVVVGQ